MTGIFLNRSLREWLLPIHARYADGKFYAKPTQRQIFGYTTSLRVKLYALKNVAIGVALILNPSSIFFQTTFL